MTDPERHDSGPLGRAILIAVRPAWPRPGWQLGRMIYGPAPLVGSEWIGNPDGRILPMTDNTPSRPPLVHEIGYPTEWVADPDLPEWAADAIRTENTLTVIHPAAHDWADALQDALDRRTT